MDDSTRTFNRLRPRLQGIAYRMLSSKAEAEEVVQDAWLRWHEAAHGTLDSAEAWLVTVTTHLAIDRLRAAKVPREHYAGMWLPEPRAAILLREVLDTEYDELANLLSKNMATCRQMVRRATMQLRDKRPPPRDSTLHWL